jgi:hypothetical protein
MASTFVGLEPMDKVKRWSESKKEHIMVDRPKSIQVYNDYMGGVDKIDFLISLYRISAKTRKWPVRAICHFLDFALANSWLEYRDFELEHGTTKSQVLDLLSFRNEVGMALIKSIVGAIPVPRLGRPRLSISSNVEDESQPPKRAKQAIRPVKDVRFDRCDHMPESVDDNPQRCKLEGCKSRSRVKCLKCEVYLCLTKDRNCFKDFHTK